MLMDHMPNLDEFPLKPTEDHPPIVEFGLTRHIPDLVVHVNYLPLHDCLGLHECWSETLDSYQRTIGKTSIVAGSGGQLARSLSWLLAVSVICEKQSDTTAEGKWARAAAGATEGFRTEQQAVYLPPTLPTRTRTRTP